MGKFIIKDPSGFCCFAPVWTLSVCKSIISVSGNYLLPSLTTWLSWDAHVMIGSAMAHILNIPWKDSCVQMWSFWGWRCCVHQWIDPLISSYCKEVALGASPRRACLPPQRLPFLFAFRLPSPEQLSLASPPTRSFLPWSPTIVDRIL